MKRIKYILILLVISTCWLCRNDEKQTISLAGTEWKLESIVDSIAGTVRVLEPQDCKECYTLKFNTDYTASGLIINGNIKLDLLNLDSLGYMVKTLYVEAWNGTEYFDSMRFRDAMRRTGSYSLSSNELKLFYHGKDNYLLFKRITQ
jgi:hypothetical protein